MAYRIRELREKKKLTQEQLAQMSGVSRTTIVLLENNEEHEATQNTQISMSNRIMLMMRPENNSDVPIRMDLCRQSTDTAWENTETKRGREISLSVQCRMCLESGFLIDGSGKCLMLIRLVRATLQHGLLM